MKKSNSSGLGFLCGLFSIFGLWGAFLYPTDSEDRHNFIKAWIVGFFTILIITGIITIFYYGKLKQKRLSGFLTKKEAEKAYSEFVTTHQQGKRSDYSKMTFNQLYDNYLNYSKNRLRVSTIYDITHNFNKHLLPVFGNMKIFDISKKDIHI